jgi:hypothetical protein
MEQIKTIVVVDDPYAEGVHAAAVEQGLLTLTKEANAKGFTPVNVQTQIVEDDEGIVEGMKFGYLFTADVEPLSKESVLAWMHRSDDTLGQRLQDALNGYGVEGPVMSIVANADETAVVRVITDEEGNAVLMDDKETLATAVEVFDTRV